MKLDEVKELINILEENNLKKIQFKKGDLEILLEKFDIEKESIKQEVVKAPSSEIVAEKKAPEKEEKYVKSPMVGTFYATPAPDQPQFVKKGDKINEDTIVCIIEAMKVMNEVKAGRSGIIEEILIENGKPVEFGTKLFVVR